MIFLIHQYEIVDQIEVDFYLGEIFLYHDFPGLRDPKNIQP